MKTVLMYSTDYCSYCVKAKMLLEAKQAKITEIRVDEHPEKRTEMIHRSGRDTVPQIFIGDKHVGGCDDLYALEASGQLDELLQN